MDLARMRIMRETRRQCDYGDELLNFNATVLE